MKKAIILLFIVGITVLSACSEDEVVKTLENIEENISEEPMLGDHKDNPIEVQFGETFVVEEKENKFVDGPLGKAEVSLSNFKIVKDFREIEPIEKDSSDDGMFSIKEKNQEHIQKVQQQFNDENDIVQFDISIQNLADTSLDSSFLGFFSFEFYDANGKSIDAKEMSDSEYDSSELRPGGSNEGNIIFRVPEGEVPVEIIFRAQFPNNTTYYIFPVHE